MTLLDKTQQLRRDVIMEQLRFIMQKDPTLATLPINDLQKPSPADLADKIAFEYLWRKGQLRSSTNSFTFGTHNMLSASEKKELSAANPEFAKLEEVSLEDPMWWFDASKVSTSEARKMLQTLSALDVKFRIELNRLQAPLQEQIMMIEAQIRTLDSNRKKPNKLLQPTVSGGG